MSTENEDKLTFLEEKFPQSTPNERSRFLLSKKGDKDAAATMLESYLNWREEHGLGESQKSTGDDALDWEEASQAALKWSESNGTDGVESTTTSLPQLVFVANDPSTGAPALADGGSIILHVMPARMDTTLAPSETYVLALTLYLDRKFERDSTLMGTVFLDVRGGKGWPNPPALSIMPFIRAATNQLYNYYPQRLERCLTYPLPTAALFVWEIAKPFLDRDLVNSITLISGSDKSAAPPPIDDLSLHAKKEFIEQMEAKRVSMFLEGTE